MSRPPLPRSVAGVGVAALLVLATLGGCAGDDAPAASPAESDSSSSSSSVPSSTVPSGGGDDPAIDCPAPAGDLAPFGVDAVTVVAGDGTEAERCVVVADRADLRSQGLMGVTDLAPFDAMVFAYADTSAGGYWMRDTPMPLSIAWIGVDGRVVATADMEPCLDRGSDCPSYEPGAEYRWAIEVPQGDLDAFGLTEGAALEVSSLPVGLD